MSKRDTFTTCDSSCYLTPGPPSVCEKLEVVCILFCSLKVPWLLLYECFYIAFSGPLIQYSKTFKKFSLGAELQSIRASPTDDIMNPIWYYESQTTASGSPTSLVLWIDSLKYMNHDIEEKVISPPCGRQGSGGRQSRATIPFSSRFMYFRESKPKFLSPISFSTMAEITPTTSLVVERRQRTRHVRCHNINSRKVIQITKKKIQTLALQCVYSHTHTGEVIWPLMTTYGAKFKIGASELSLFKGGVDT